VTYIDVERDILSSETVTIKVGPSSQEYRINKLLITHYSEYFRTALKPESFEEGSTGTITLDDIEPSTFEAFADWLYTGRLPSLDEYSHCYGATDESEDESLVSLYIFADRFLVPKLKPTVIMHLIDWCNEYGTPWYRTIVHAFSYLRNDSPVLDLLVDAFWISWVGVEEEDENDQEVPFETLPPNFLRRVMIKYANNQQYSDDDLDADNYREKETVNDKSTNEEPPQKEGMT
jgi:hypothetical protein